MDTATLDRLRMTPDILICIMQPSGGLGISIISHNLFETKNEYIIKLDLIDLLSM